MLDAEYGLYFKVARLFAKVIGNPPLLGQLTRVGMQSRTLMEWVLRIMANLLREDELGPAEAAYKAAAALVRVVPEPAPPETLRTPGQNRLHGSGLTVRLGGGGEVGGGDSCGPG